MLDIFFYFHHYCLPLNSFCLYLHLRFFINGCLFIFKSEALKCPFCECARILEKVAVPSPRVSSLESHRVPQIHVREPQCETVSADVTSEDGVTLGRVALNAVTCVHVRRRVPETGLWAVPGSPAGSRSCRRHREVREPVLPTPSSSTLASRPRESGHLLFKTPGAPPRSSQPHSLGESHHPCPRGGRPRTEVLPVGAPGSGPSSHLRLHFSQTAVSLSGFG